MIYVLSFQFWISQSLEESWLLIEVDGTGNKMKDIHFTDRSASWRFFTIYSLKLIFSSEIMKQKEGLLFDSPRYFEFLSLTVLKKARISCS
jgi:hypothetical protein